MLYRSTDSFGRCGAAMKNLAHRASFHSHEKTAPSNHGTKHLAHGDHKPVNCCVDFLICGRASICDADGANVDLGRTVQHRQERDAAGTTAEPIDAGDPDEVDIPCVGLELRSITVADAETVCLCAQKRTRAPPGSTG
jgi:hypothetical protein